ncbi:cytochrome c oxidase subunit II [Shinella zoogloeoides]|uniref:Cytochrome c oxidase subunit 2 n=1 Tax=Shinella zoogloeoides TaxID=352475 RepID=A0A6N8TFX0_SHIZO|nr:cytochrome c oxidase subunit II [Shinella zoogloeoides]MXO00078.1 cytochrome c oxidase subunit II [Shinella zoogloeoides]UEX82415.1 cytochrome c oxidase subunit II [Shinella zoogloeoides]
MKNKAFAVLAAIGCLLFASTAFADQPVEWQRGLQPAATSIMEEIRWFEQYTLWFIVPVTLFVLVLLIIVVVRFRERANPVPSKTSHNTLIEIIWTLGPVLILLALAIPSFQLLTKQLAPTEEPELTIKATGYQWYWGYEYQVGEAPLSFDSLLLQDADRAAAGKEDKAVYPRLLTVDNELVVPVGKHVRLLVTAADVIHAFAMPSFGIKIDAVPGRLNETWFRADREGLFYGQCSELCGKDHAFMPIAIRVVSQEKYDTWLAAAATNLGDANKALMASVDGAAKSVDVAQNAAQ